MALYSTHNWQTQFRQFLRRKQWTYIRWSEKINEQLIYDNRHLHLTEFTLARWVNSTPDKPEYRGPKTREEYVGIAHALIELEVIDKTEAFNWLLQQGLYPLPHERIIFGCPELPAPNEIGCQKSAIAGKNSVI